MKSGCWYQPFKPINNPKKNRVVSWNQTDLFITSVYKICPWHRQDDSISQHSREYSPQCQGDESSVFITCQVPQSLQERQYCGQKQIKSRTKTLKLRNSNKKDALRSQCWFCENIWRNMGRTEKEKSPFQPFFIQKTTKIPCCPGSL